MQTPVLLVRSKSITKYELTRAAKHFPIEESRMSCRDRLVVGRYSVEPFYDELDRDLRLVGSRLINSYPEHLWITSFAYYRELKDYTPETWDDESIHLCAHRGPFVVKGKMSSKKHNWNTLMFAPTKRAALDLADRLKEDGDLREQGVVYRKYVPLKTYQVSHNGLPYANEWRFFYLKNERLGYGYYWSQADCVQQAELKPEAIALADHVASIAAQHVNFFSLDVAETESGEWILIELNDGQMAVPSEIDLDELYGRLRARLDESTT
jgi:hypothetical protein